ncbi:polyprenol phosphomannose-dependent alpha 1,6 mannosyltransferase MptB [Mariniluteicoccus flavus]
MRELLDRPVFAPVARVRGLRASIIDALVEAFSVRWVRRGMIGTFLIALGSVTPAFLPANSPWWKVLGIFRRASWLAPSIGTLVTLVGIVLVMEAWLRLRPDRAVRQVDFRAVLVLWSFPMLLAPPIFSHDAYAYAAEGYMLHVGMNPYEMGAGTLNNRWGEQVVEVWRFTRAPYGPLSLQLSHLMVLVCGQSPYWSASVGMRLLSVLGMIAVAFAIPHVARHVKVDERRAMWFGLVNPLTITHLIGGAHNDAWMLGFVALALYAAVNRRFLLGCLLVAAAAAVKMPAIIAIVPVAVLALPVDRPMASAFGRLWQAGWRVALGTVVSLICFLFISLACGVGFGWIEAINVPGQVVTISPPTMLGEITRAILNWTGNYRAGLGVVRLFRQVAMGITVLVVLWLLVKLAPRHPLTFLCFAWTAVILGSPALHPWYFSWPAIVFAFARPSALLMRIACWGTILLLAYSSVSFSWRNESLALGVAAVAAFAWVIWGHDRENYQLRRRRTRP